MVENPEILEQIKNAKLAPFIVYIGNDNSSENVSENLILNKYNYLINFRLKIQNFSEDLKFKLRSKLIKIIKEPQLMSKK
ncbi:MAG: hypothetical protein MHPSP_000844, partial [Paramarteilia canceri]